jgi:hypothetical protein
MPDLEALVSHRHQAQLSGIDRGWRRTAKLLANANERTDPRLKERWRLRLAAYQANVTGINCRMVDALESAAGSVDPAFLPFQLTLVR